MSGRRAMMQLTLVAAALAAGVAHAQGSVESYHVQGNVYMLSGAGSNVAVQVGDEGVLVVDTGAAASREALLTAIREIADGRPIRWIINTNGDLDHTGGNETVSQAGLTVNGNPAAIVAHENVLARMTAANRPVTEMPLNTFFESGRDFFFNGEAVFLYHEPSQNDGNIFVYFRGSDVLVSGDLFVTTQYPVIDLEAGGGVDGYLDGLNKMLDIAVPAYLQEGGTYVIPGHGRVGDEADLLTFRDMLFIVRARIADMVTQGKTLEQVLAAKPALDYDTRYDTRAYTSAQFVEAIYRDLKDNE